ncbi:unnamed protein product [Onchocerca flexuosa]|uniref:Cytochrome b561 domain-containing protein n=1 Tax=Onchocerca flexuosa TaxID=387005 RepID=A0A183H224_9BILA|nr:unnamed protein product [Onchocerca flexuosa]
MKSIESNKSQNRFHIEDIRVLNAISVQLYLSLITVVYSVLQGLVFQKPVNVIHLIVRSIAVLFAIIGVTQLRLFWFLYTGWRYKSLYLLRMHFILSLFCIIAIFVLCVIIGLMDLYAIGPFQYTSIRNYFQSHVLVALCSLVPFIIGFNASWRFYCETKNEMCKPVLGYSFLKCIADYQRYQKKL